MTKVYVVLHGHRYEGLDVHSIWYREAAALHEKTLLEEKNLQSWRPSSSYYVEIEEHDVN